MWIEHNFKNLDRPLPKICLFLFFHCFRLYFFFIEPYWNGLYYSKQRRSTHFETLVDVVVGSGYRMTTILLIQTIFSLISLFSLRNIYSCLHAKYNIWTVCTMPIIVISWSLGTRRYNQYEKNNNDSTSIQNA